MNFDLFDFRADNVFLFTNRVANQTCPLTRNRNTILVVQTKAVIIRNAHIDINAVTVSSLIDV